MTLDEAFTRLRARDEVVPKPLTLPTIEEVNAAERDLGIPFHDDFRRFQVEVSNVNVGWLEPALALPGVMAYRNLCDVAARGWKAGAPRDSLPFCWDNGDYFLIDADGRIAFWDHNARAVVRLNKTLADWIVEDWLDSDANE